MSQYLFSLSAQISSVLLHELNTIIFTLAEVIGCVVVCVMVCNVSDLCVNGLSQPDALVLAARNRKLSKCLHGCGTAAPRLCCSYLQWLMQHGKSSSVNTSHHALGSQTSRKQTDFNVKARASLFISAALRVLPNEFYCLSVCLSLH